MCSNLQLRWDTDADIKYDNEHMDLKMIIMSYKLIFYVQLLTVYWERFDVHIYTKISIVALLFKNFKIVMTNEIHRKSLFQSAASSMGCISSQMVSFDQGKRLMSSWCLVNV